jgi:NAD(P)H-flavin reductase
MHSMGEIQELLLLDDLPAARIKCSAGLRPLPGQYVLAHADDSREPVATAIFASKIFDDGFLVAPPIPQFWQPGHRLHLWGPLGHGFHMPAFARHVAFFASEVAPHVVLSLLLPAFRQGASVTLISDTAPGDLPLPVEVQPLQALPEVCQWADFVALDAPRDSWARLRDQLPWNALSVLQGQVLIRTAMPCGGLADCGVCSVPTSSGDRLACLDGPVFDIKSLRLKS